MHHKLVVGVVVFQFVVGNWLMLLLNTVLGWVLEFCKSWVYGVVIVGREGSSRKYGVMVESI